MLITCGYQPCGVWLTQQQRLIASVEGGVPMSGPRGPPGARPSVSRFSAPRCGAERRRGTVARQSMPATSSTRRRTPDPAIVNSWCRRLSFPPPPPATPLIFPITPCGEIDYLLLCTSETLADKDEGEGEDKGEDEGCC